MCGIVGVWAPEGEAAALAFAGAASLQHRGQESWGVVVAGRHGVADARALGLVRVPAGLVGSSTGRLAVAHTRYSTTGASTLENSQPLVSDEPGHRVVVAHNGNVTNAVRLRETLGATGFGFRATTDSEVILGLLASIRGDHVTAVRQAMRHLEGAYAVVAAIGDALVAFRDPHGYRPLAIGTAGTATIVASETCALDVLGCRDQRELRPGEVVVVGRDGRHGDEVGTEAPQRFCVFEYVYLARRDSRLGDRLVGATRVRAGRELAREAPVDADAVVPVPASGALAGVGYAQETGLPLFEALVRNEYVGRTFIEPDPALRELGLKIKFNVLEGIEGRSVVLVDDSIVRGPTMRQVVELIRARGAREVHVRIASPPLVAPCRYGIDIGSSSELIAAGRSVEDVRRMLGATSLRYLSLDGLRRAVDADADGGICTACFTARASSPAREPAVAHAFASER